MPEQNNNQSNTLPVGYKLREYEIIKVLGQGGFGITYKVYDTNLDTVMVIKEYMPNSFALRTNNTTITCIPKDKDTFDWGKQRFLEEAKTLRKFDHPAIVKVFNLFEMNNTAYFVMDYYEGETLEDYLKRYLGKHFNQDEILSIMMPIIEGLKDVHKQGFLHRDIAPDNIFLRVNKLPVLIDFGASRNAIGTKSQNISAIVKHGYSPPEQYTSNSSQNVTTDLYAVCAVMYEMITGKKPPESTHRQSEVFNGNNDPIEDIVTKYKDRYNASFLQTIQKGLSLKQKDRIQNIEELQDGLVKEDDNKDIEKKDNDKTVVLTLDKEPTPDEVLAPSSGGDGRNNKNSLLYGIIGLLAITLIGGAFYMYSSNPNPKHTSKPIPRPEPVIKTCSDGNAIACKEKGDKYYSNNDTTKALEYYTKACNLGDKTSCDKKSSIEDAQKIKKNQKKATLKSDTTINSNNSNNSQNNSTQEKIFTKEKIEQFLQRFIDVTNSDDVQEMLTLYAQEVSPYFSMTRATHSEIYNDKKSYIKRWSKSSYKLENYKLEDCTESNPYCVLTVTILWKAENSKKIKEGESTLYMQLHNENNSYKIVGVKSINSNTFLNKSKVSNSVVYSDNKVYHLGDEEIKNWRSLYGRCYSANFRVDTKGSYQLMLKRFGVESAKILLNNKFVSILPRQHSQNRKRPNFWSDTTFVSLPSRYINDGINRLSICSDLVNNPEHPGDLDDLEIKNIKIKKLNIVRY